MPDHGAGQTELVVVARPDASLRAHGARVTSVVDADTSSLNSLLEAHGARLQPLFGLSEERLRDRAPVSAGPSTASTGQAEAPIEDLTLFYRAIAHEDRLDELAQELLANELVEAAYVKPAAAPPCAAVAPTPAVRRSLRRAQHDPRPQRLLLGGRGSPEHPLQRAVVGFGELDRSCRPRHLDHRTRKNKGLSVRSTSSLRLDRRSPVWFASRCDESG